MRYFAGIGSRETPDDICLEMTQISKFLYQHDFCLRSGAAIGADKAFERGATNKEIFLPWEGYEGSDSQFTAPSEQAVALCRKLFPHFPGVSRGTRLMLSRNMHQVLGPEIGVSPRSEFVICWTSNGKKKGGTAYAMKAAEYFGIPIFNLYNDSDRIKMWRYFEDYVVTAEDLE